MEIRSNARWQDFDMMLEAAHSEQAELVRRYQFNMVGQVNDLIADLCLASSPEDVVNILADNEARVLAACEEVARIKRRNPLGFC